MIWIAPSEKDQTTGTLENRLWAAADQLRANSGLTSAQYSQPVLGLIFLRFAEIRFVARRAVLEKKAAGGRRGSRVDEPDAYQAEGVVYLTPNARFDHLLRLPEGRDVGKALNEAMRDIEKHNSQLAGVLPKTYELFTSTLLKELLKKVSEIPATTEGDAFGARRPGPAPEDTLDGGLSRAYTPELYESKCSTLFEHAFRALWGWRSGHVTDTGSREPSELGPDRVTLEARGGFSHQRRPEIHICLIGIVRTAPKLNILNRRLAAGRKRHDMVEFQESMFRTAAVRTDERALTSVTCPHYPSYRGRHVA